jgi:hypothetical protein
MKIINKTFVTALAAVSLAAFGTSPAAFAEEDDHHGHGDIEVGSTDAGAGQLMGEYNFESVLRTDFANEVGPVLVYGSTTPGIGAAEDEAPELYELNVGTTVEFALINIDEGLSIQIGATTLDEIGESASLGTYDGTPGEDGTLHPTRITKSHWIRPTRASVALVKAISILSSRILTVTIRRPTSTPSMSPMAIWLRSRLPRKQPPNVRRL